MTATIGVHKGTAVDRHAIDMPGWPVLHPDALHGVAGEVVRTIDPQTEADPVALLADFLVSFGSCVGAGPHAVAGSTAHPARLNVVIVGDTARARKGTARAAVAELFAEVDPGWHGERVLGGLASGEGLIASVRDPVDDEDKTAPRDKRLLVVEPEFVRVLTVCAREGSTLSAVIRDCWDSGRLRVMTRKDPLVATGAHVSLVAHITAEELVRKLTDTEIANGMANRMLFVCSKRSKLLPSGGEVHPDELVRLNRLIRQAVEAARKVGRVRRTDAAEALWATMYESLATADPGGLVGAITARAEAQLLRLSVVYALLDGSRWIEEQHLRAAWSFWEYAEASARYVFRDSLGDPDAEKLLNALEVYGPKGMSSTEQFALFKRHRTADQLELLRHRLEQAGRIVTVTIPTGGRPEVRTWLSDFANQAKEAKKGADRG